MDETAYVETTFSFARARSRRSSAITLGKASSVYKGTMFDAGPEAVIWVGDYSLLAGVRIICDRQVTIGTHALISWNVLLMDSYRFSTDAAVRRRQLQQFASQQDRLPPFTGPTSPITIGDNVWIGFDACVLPGVKIGDGAIIGARSVVIDDVAPYSVAGGNPAEVIPHIDTGRGFQCRSVAER